MLRHLGLYSVKVLIRILSFFDSQNACYREVRVNVRALTFFVLSIQLSWDFVDILKIHFIEALLYST